MSAFVRQSLAEPAFAARIRREVEGEAYFDALSRARYATDASLYKIMPLGVVLPKTEADVAVIAKIAAEYGLPLTARGGGTSTAGQAVSEGLIVDFSKYLRHLTFYDLRSMTCVVQPGMTLNALNAELAGLGVWFPVDIWSGSQATIGGMCGNNAAGMRSLRYGAMRDNVTAIDAVLAGGGEICFGEIKDDAMGEASPLSAGAGRDIAFDLMQIGERYETLIKTAAKGAPQQAGGYHLPGLLPDAGAHNLASLLVGSEGTLALFKRIELKLQPLPRNWALGVCQFQSLRRAFGALPGIAALKPSAIEFLEAQTLRRAASHPAHAPAVERCLRGAPEALILVEFAEDNQVENVRRLKELSGIAGGAGGRGVIEAVGTALQRSIWAARSAALEAHFTTQTAKQLPFLDNCAVPFAELTAYTDRIGEVLARRGVAFAWHGSAMGDALAIRPLHQTPDQLSRPEARALAEEAAAHIRNLKGALSSGEGAGLARSEFAEAIHGRSAMSIFEEVKTLFDPALRLNPGKIVFAPRADDPMLRRGAKGGRGPRAEGGEWFASPEDAPRNLLAAAEACNGLGVCRKLEGGEMCPSFRVTRDEKLSPRGMANALRAALTDDAGGGLGAPDVQAAMKHCVSCKACRTECPMGVDIARMKIEVLQSAVQNEGLAFADKLFAYLPHYAAQARRWRWALYLRDAIPPLARAAEGLTGFSADRGLPRWRGRRLRMNGPAGPDGGREIALFADTFNLHFEPDNLRAAADVFAAAGYRVHYIKPPEGERPLCCGRTFLSAGLTAEARAEAQRLVSAATPFVERGVPVIGLEPACLLTLRDETPLLLPGAGAKALAKSAALFEEFVAAEREQGRFSPSLRPVEAEALLHGHCHQKAFGAMGAVQSALSLIPGLSVETIQSSCCGMAGGFGYRPENIELSFAMGELSLFPAIRGKGRDTLIIADGFSCRQQIRDGMGRTSRHAAMIFKLALNAK